jgi:hypothetical protein
MQPLYTLSMIAAMKGMFLPPIRNTGMSPRDFGERWNGSPQRRKANRKAKRRNR